LAFKQFRPFRPQDNLSLIFLIKDWNSENLIEMFTFLTQEWQTKQEHLRNCRRNAAVK